MLKLIFNIYLFLTNTLLSFQEAHKRETNLTDYQKLITAYLETNFSKLKPEYLGLVCYQFLFFFPTDFQYFKTLLTPLLKTTGLSFFIINCLSPTSLLSTQGSSQVGFQQYNIRFLNFCWLDSIIFCPLQYFMLQRFLLDLVHRWKRNDVYWSPAAYFETCNKILVKVFHLSNWTFFTKDIRKYKRFFAQFEWYFDASFDKLSINFTFL